MKCPNCGYTKTRTIDSRPNAGVVRRRYVCGSCSNRFTTLERPVEIIPGSMSTEDQVRKQTIDEKLNTATNAELLEEIRRRMREAEQVSICQQGSPQAERKRSRLREDEAAMNLADAMDELAKARKEIAELRTSIMAIHEEYRADVVDAEW